MAGTGPEAEAGGANIRTLKFIVIALGVAILLVGVGVAWGVVRNVQKLGQSPADAPAQASAPVATGTLTGFGSQTLVLPIGARVLDAQANDGRLVVRVLRPDGSEQILLYALTGGAKLGELNVVPRP